MSISDFLEEAWIEHTLAIATYLQPSGIFMALSTTDPLDDGSGITEPAAIDGYVREEVPVWETGDTVRKVVNTNDIQWAAAATGDWGTLTHFGLFDAVTGGNFLGGDALFASLDVDVGAVPFFAAQSFLVEVTPGKMADGWAQALLEHTFLISAPLAAPTAPHVALTTTTIVDANTGTTIVEPTDASYARQPITNWSTTGTDGERTNTDQILFTAGTGFGVILDGAICDGSTNGTLLIFGVLSPTSLNVAAGQQVRFEPTNILASLA